MSEMVEKVRAALATDQMRSTLAAAGLEFEPAQDAFLEVYARAAIEAMREPTDAMVDVGQDAFAEGINMVAGHPEPSDEASYQTYIAMIDSALSEVEG